MSKVQITVVYTTHGRSRVESNTLDIEDVPSSRVGRIIGDTARIVGERAVFGQMLPTPRREGGRG